MNSTKTFFGRLLRAFAHIALVIFFLEILLRVFDPIGAVYYTEVNHLFTEFVVDPITIYKLPPGTYQFSNFMITMTETGRTVPDTSESDCQIAAIGDSVTFGYGVNDKDTWINLLAREFPEVQFINAGLSHYNSTHILRSMEKYSQVDGYIYLITANDVERGEFLYADDQYIDYVPYFVLYIMYFRTAMSGESDTLPDTAGFFADIEAIAEHDNVIYFVHEESAQEIMRSQGYEVPLISFGDARISAVDAHPNADGTRRIAAHMKPYITDLIEEACN